MGNDRMLPRTARIAGLAALLLLAGPGAGDARADSEPQQAGPAAVAALLERLGQEAGQFETLATEFVQEKHLAIFREAVVMSGRIILQKPGRIAWHVDRPVRYSVIISGDTVRQWDEDTDRVQELSLARNPILQNVLGQLTVWFSGSYGSLLKEYEVQVVGQSPASLRFIPRKANMAAKVIRHIQVEFRDDNRYLRKIEIVEQGGDRSDITFTNTRFNIPLERGDFEVKRGA